MYTKTNSSIVFFCSLYMYQLTNPIQHIQMVIGLIFYHQLQLQLIPLSLEIEGKSYALFDINHGTAYILSRKVYKYTFS
jgi:hypothetical protein